MGKPKHSSSRSSKKDDRATKQLIRKQKAKRQASNDYETEKTFNRLINNMGLFIRIVQGDGNCFFRSISDQLKVFSNKFFSNNKY